MEDVEEKQGNKSYVEDFDSNKNFGNRLLTCKKNYLTIVQFCLTFDTEL